MEKQKCKGHTYLRMRDFVPEHDSSDDIKTSPVWHYVGK